MSGRRSITPSIKPSILNFFFNLQINVKTAHLMTESFAKHKATDSLYDNVNDISDKFLEIYLGRYGRPSLKIETVLYKNMSDGEFIEYIKQCKIFLETKIYEYITEKDTDMLNIRDELLGELNKTLYLLTLK